MLAELDESAQITTAWARFADGADEMDVVREVQTALTDLQAASPGNPTAWLGGSGVERAGYQEVISTLLAIVVALLGVSVVIALVGVANTLSLSVLERRRESATLRAMGLSRGRLRGMLAAEAVLISFAGAVIGIVAGVAYGWAGSTVMLSGLGDVTLMCPGATWAWSWPVPWPLVWRPRCCRPGQRCVMPPWWLWPAPSTGTRLWITDPGVHNAPAGPVYRPGHPRRLRDMADDDAARVRGAMRTHVHIAVIAGPDAGWVAGLDSRGIIVGRGADAGLRLCDAHLSRNHLHLRHRSGRIQVRDLDSANGSRWRPARGRSRAQSARVLGARACDGGGAAGASPAAGGGYGPGTCCTWAPAPCRSVRTRRYAQPNPHVRGPAAWIRPCREWCCLY
ncbi:FtsX-like permease family protein [Sanguibacter sp. Z1732]|uniref:FtsX-like permease family protein n=1 Tax=Sanguibacter sp. Z1732 TaxID=3435412 RepID=UPI003D9C9C98